jgi:hypothetical protein
MKNEFGGAGTAAQLYLDQLQLGDYSKWIDILIILAMILTFRGLGYLGMRRSLRK